MMGISVTRGARETFIPSLTPCPSVCAMTSVRRGPGEKPADKPNTTAAVMKVIMVCSAEARPFSACEREGQGSGR